MQLFYFGVFEQVHFSQYVAYLHSFAKIKLLVFLYSGDSKY